MREALLSVGWLQHSEAIWISKTCVEPASHQDISKHVDLVPLKTDSSPWLAVVLLFLAFALLLGCALLCSLHKNSHHGSDCVWHPLSTDDKTFEDLMDDQDAVSGQVLLLLSLWDSLGVTLTLDLLLLL